MNQTELQLPSMERLLTLDEVRHHVPLSQSQIYRMIKQGSFPAQLRLGPNRVAWRSTDIMQWVEQRQRSTASS
jgi:prophage regulatory protein